MSNKKLTVDAELEKLQRETFGYFFHETNPANNLVIDKTAADWPASIAATALHWPATRQVATASFSVLGYDHDLTEPVIHAWNDRVTSAASAR